MATKMRTAEIEFRPHFKTHQSEIIGEWFREEGIDRITVSSVGMAKYFADAGWNDITISFPVNLREINEINELAGRIKLGILISAPGIATQIDSLLTNDLNAWIEVDTGHKRSGIADHDREDLTQAFNEISAAGHLKIEGFLSHTGNTYQVRGVSQVMDKFIEASVKLSVLKEKIANDDPAIRISMGDTPTASILDDFPGVYEYRPGNFVFYDLMQNQIGSCTLEQIAVVLACPVVASYPQRNELVIYGGAIHLSKEFIEDEDGSKNFGQLAILNNNGWEPLPQGNKLISLSQEHGVARLTKKYIDKFRAGDLIGVIPVHSCLTADIMGAYTTIDGKKIDHFSGKVRRPG